MPGAEVYADFKHGLSGLEKSLAAGDFPAELALTRPGDTTPPTMVDSGLVKFGPHNLASKSKELDDAAWTLIGAANTVTPNVANDPEGQLTADQLNFGAAPGSGRRLSVTASTVPGQEVTVSVFAQVASGTEKFRLGIDDNGGPQQVSASMDVTTVLTRFDFTATYTAGSTARQFDIINGSSAAASVIFSFIQLNAGAAPLDFVPTTTAAVFNPRFPKDDGSSLWSAGSVAAYLYEYAETNSVISQDPNDAAYTKSFVTIGNQVADVGILQGYEVLETTDNSNHDLIYKLTKSAAAETWAGQCFVSGGLTKTHVMCRMRNAAGTVGTTFIVRLSDGVVTVGATDIGAGFTDEKVRADLLDGLVRLSIKATTDATAAVWLEIRSLEGTATESFVGTVTEGFHFYGEDLIKDGNNFSSHIPTSGALITRVSDVADFGTALPWFSSDEGALIFDGHVFGGPAASNRLVALALNVDNHVRLEQPSAPQIDISAEGGGTGATTSVATSTYVEGDRIRVGATYDFGVGTTAVANAGVVDTDAGLATPLAGAPDAGKLFEDPDVAGRQTSGLIRVFQYIPDASTDIQDLTNLTSSPAATTQGALLVSLTSDAVVRASQALFLAAYSVPESRYIRTTEAMLQAAYAGGPVIRTSDAALLAAFRTGPVENLNNRSWTYTLDGHTFYVLSLGEQGTFVYDLTTGEWSQFITGGLNTWNMEIGTSWKGDVVAGDQAEPTIWRMTPNSFIDDGFKSMTRVATGGLSVRQRLTVPNYAFRISASLGVPDVALTAPVTDPAVTLEISDDQGKTYQNVGSLTLEEGNFRQTLQWLSLGVIQAPNRIFRITDEGAIARIDGADAEVETDEDSTL